MMMRMIRSPGEAIRWEANLAPWSISGEVETGSP